MANVKSVSIKTGDTAVAGATITVTVTVLNINNVPVINYAGKVHFTSSDSQAILPVDSTLTSGVGVFSVMLKTPGIQTVKATAVSIVGTLPINVMSAIASHFEVAGLPESANIEAVTKFTVTAKDVNGNVVSNFNGLVAFSSTDPLAVLPVDSALSNGVGIFTASFGTTGQQAITATNSINGSESIVITTSVLPLLALTDLQYVGSFRMPNYYDSTDEMSYGGTAICYNPVNNSLFMAAHNQAIGEFDIPELVSSSNLDDLNTATIIQPWANVLYKIPNPTPGATQIGGLMLSGKGIVGTVYVYYDNSETTASSHFLLDSTELATANVTGAFTLGSGYAGYVAGYMSPIPLEWQSALGFTTLTGQADIPIIGRTSSGPDAYGFNVADLGAADTPTVAYLFYPTAAPLGDYEGSCHPIQSGNSTVTGCVFIPGTRTVLFFGSTNSNWAGYGEATPYNDTAVDSKGPHSLNGEYAIQIWAYDAADFTAVNPFTIRPYAVWNIDFPITSGPKYLGGAAFDPSTGKIYLSLLHADHEAPNSNLPVIHVLQVKYAEPSTEPLIGTIGVWPNAATIDVPMGGPVPVGTIMTVTAGNVYGASAVTFYLNDTFLGDGVKDPNYQDWSLSFSTTSLTSGQYTISAIAGSQIKTTTLRIM